MVDQHYGDVDGTLVKREEEEGEDRDAGGGAAVEFGGDGAEDLKARVWINQESIYLAIWHYLAST